MQWLYIHKVIERSHLDWMYRKYVSNNALVYVSLLILTHIEEWLDVFHGKLQEGSLPWKAAFGGTALYTNGSLGGNTMSVLYLP